MADVNDLAVHDVNTSEQSFFTPSGGVAKKVRLSFFVGSHGPFTREFEPQEATADKMKAAIDSQVQTLRILAAAQYGQ
jgi:hypothetical protein